MGAVLLTGATGFVGMELLSRFLAAGDRQVYALVRATDDRAAAERLPAHPCLTAVAGDIEQPGLGLARPTADRLADEVSTVVHCAATVSFDLPLDKSRRVNVDGTRHVLDLAERCRRLERLSYISTAYVAGEPRGTFREDQLDVGQSFRNAYEQSKFEAERMLRERAGDLPLQIMRPSIIVGDSRTGRTSSFNVLYAPLKAFARGRVPAIPARRSSPVDIVPVDYVADRAHELATSGPDGTFHLVAGRNATTVGRLIELSERDLRRPAPRVLPPTLYRRLLHPWLRRKNAGLRRMEVYFPYFSMRVRFDDRRLGPGPPVESYFHRLVDYAQRARWGRVPSAV
jgi:thioester reductase-like protein